MHELFTHHAYMAADVYFVKPLSNGVWQTCSYDDIHSPDYEPHFVITMRHRTTKDMPYDDFAIYNCDGLPIACTDLGIFRHAPKIDLHAAIVCQKEEIFDESSSGGRMSRKV